jgi:hypothetical protein
MQSNSKFNACGPIYRGKTYSFAVTDEIIHEDFGQFAMSERDDRKTSFDVPRVRPRSVGQALRETFLVGAHDLNFPPQ